MTEITFEKLPQAITQIYAKLENIERLLLLKGTEHQPQADFYFDLNGLCEYIPDKPAPATVYGYVHKKVIPYHKGPKKLRFLKSEIDTWLAEGRKKTLTEITNDAGQYIIKRKGGKL